MHGAGLDKIDRLAREPFGLAVEIQFGHQRRLVAAALPAPRCRGEFRPVVNLLCLAACVICAKSNGMFFARAAKPT